MAIGRLMRTVPEIVEIDVNPLMVHAKGQGATALDALIVADDRQASDGSSNDMGGAMRLESPD